MVQGYISIYKYEQEIYRSVFNSEELVQDLKAIMGLDVFTEAMFIFFGESNTEPVDTGLQVMYNQVLSQVYEDIPG